MRQPSFLEFDNMHMRDHLAKYPVFKQIEHQRIQFQPEYPGGYIRSILSGLMCLNLCSNLRPVRVTRHRDKEVRLAVSSDDGHDVVILLSHLTRPASEGRGQNDTSANIGQVPTISDRIHHSLVKVRAQLGLIAPQIIEPILFDLCIGIHNEFLEQETGAM